MKCSAIVLPLGFFAVCVCGYAQQATPKPIVAPPAQTPAVSAPAVPPPAAAEGDAAAPTGVPPAPQNFGVAAAQPAPPVSASADVGPNYILGTEDVINVNVWKDPTLTGALIVRPDGKVSLPLVGDLTAAGLTPMALAASITDQLKKFINDPTVTVTVTGVNSKRIFFIGEVMHPGPVPMTREFSMLQAISAAGGLTPYANRKKIYILRQVNGKEQKLFYNYNKALKNGDEQGIALVSGDTIVVP